MSYIYDCDKCFSKCDGVSKGNYNFKNDVEQSEYFEKMLINAIKDIFINQHRL